MSRLIVKNLPPYVTPARLREHFEQKGCPGGTLTDIKVASKQDGTSRRFGFVGYKTSQEAASAKDWFDKTFIDTTRINVAVIDGAKDAPAPRPNKRPRTGPSPQDSKPSSSKLAPIPSKKQSSDKKPAQLDEFIEAYKPKKLPLWANEMQPEPSNVVEEEPEPVNPVAMSDLDWMKSRVSTAVDATDQPAFFQSDDEDVTSDKVERPELPEPSNVDPTRDTILETSRLFVRNLAFSCTDEDLQELFGTFGPLSQVHIPLDAASKSSKGVAYVTFTNPKDALTAYQSLDRTSFQGRLLHLLAAVDRRPQKDDHADDGKKRTLKVEKLTQRKKNAGREFNWAMLYMNSDAVASSIADRMNVPKSSILNPESSDGMDVNPAVKLALAETHIIQETKSYLESQGVDLSTFSQSRPRRSDSIILVKNIPYGTSQEQVRELFEPYGPLKRVLIPPAGTLSIVEFDDAKDAKVAWGKIVYRRLGASVIYLEWGPEGMFNGKAKKQEKVADVPSQSVVRIAEQKGAAPLADVAIGESEGLVAGTTLFVKNISFSTSPERFSAVFKNLPSFSFARIQTKPDPKRPDTRLSMGYGFVGFKDPESAQKALKSMEGFVLDGHALHVRFAARGKEDDETEKSKNKSRTTKMLVKNVPFEATKKDLRQLFGAHANLKSVRLPKKFDSRTRGFAFLDFVTRQDAENAYSTLRHSHLLGRHLVLEWAEDDTTADLEALRKKVGVGYGDGTSNMPGKKRKLDFGKKGQDEDKDGLDFE